MAAIHVTGPCRIELTGQNDITSLVTFEILPAPYPPDRAAVVGPYSGNIAVTLETSKNLVDWTLATSGEIYTNSPDARFFRIVIDKRVAP